MKKQSPHSNHKTLEDKLNSGDYKRPKEKRWGNRLLRNKEEIIEMGLEVLALSYLLKQPQFETPLKDLKDAGEYLDLAFKSTEDMVKGGPEGMRSALRLQESLEIIADATETNEVASVLLNDYNNSRQELANQLSDIYLANETFVRESTRIRIELEGYMKKSFDFGNSVKPEWWEENIDEPLIIAYEKVFNDAGDLTNEEILTLAMERSAGLSEFYSEAKDFFEARNLNENTVAQLADYLTEAEQMTKEDQVLLENIIPSVVAAVQESYTTEDYVFGLGANLRELANIDLETLTEKVEDFEETVIEVRDTTGDLVDLEDTGAPGAWVDYAINPVSLALLSVCLVKGARRVLPRFIDNGIAKIIAYPFKLIGNSASYIHDKMFYSKYNNQKYKK